MGYGYGMMGGFTLISLILIGLLIFAVVRSASNTGKNNIRYRASSNALDILNQRYANGEISDEEYARMKKTLRD
ncbi:MAG: SHOCT domain-containing protein [Caulobacteraceae bacterium]